MSTAGVKNSALYESLKKMDKDLAIQVVMSGISNNPTVILNQYSIAAQIMTIREDEKARKDFEASVTEYKEFSKFIP